MFAAIRDNNNIVELLLPFSDINAKNKLGYTALDLAKDYRHDQIVKILQQHSNNWFLYWSLFNNYCKYTENIDYLVIRFEMFESHFCIKFQFKYVKSLE